MKGEPEMLEFLAVSDAVRRRTAEAVEPKRLLPVKPNHPSPKRAAVRSTSAAALRRLAERLEPSPSA